MIKKAPGSTEGLFQVIKYCIEYVIIHLQDLDERSFLTLLQSRMVYGTGYSHYGILYRCSHQE